MRVFDASTAMDDVEHIFCCKCSNVLPDHIIFPCGHHLCQKCKDITSCLTCGGPVCLIKDSVSLDCYRKLMSKGLLNPASKGTPSRMRPKAKKAAAKSCAVRNASVPSKQEKLEKKTPAKGERTPLRSSARLSCKTLAGENESYSNSSITKTRTKKNCEPQNAGEVTPNKKKTALKNAGKVAQTPKTRMCTRKNSSENAGMFPVEARLEGQDDRLVHFKKARLLQNLSASKPRLSGANKANPKTDEIVRISSPPLKKRKVSNVAEVPMTRASLRNYKLRTYGSDEDDGVFIDSDSTLCCGETHEVVAQVHADPYTSSAASLDNSQTDAIGYTQVGLGHLDDADDGVSTLISQVESVPVALSNSCFKSTEAPGSSPEAPPISLAVLSSVSRLESPSDENCQSELHLKGLNFGRASSQHFTSLESGVTKLEGERVELEDHPRFIGENDDNHVNLSSVECPADVSIIKSSVPPEEESQAQIFKTPKVKKAIKSNHPKVLEAERVIESIPATSKYIETIVPDESKFPKDAAPDATICGNTEFIEMELDTSCYDILDYEYGDPPKEDSDLSKSLHEYIYNPTVETPRHSSHSVQEDFCTPNRSSDYLKGCSNITTAINSAESHHRHPENDQNIKDQMPCYSNREPSTVGLKTLEHPEILLVDEHQADSLPVMHQGPVNAITSFTPPSSTCRLADEALPTDVLDIFPHEPGPPTDSSYDISSNLSSQTCLLDLSETKWTATHKLLTNVFSKICQPGKPKSLIRMAFEVLIIPLKESEVFHGLSALSPITESAEKSVQVELFLEQSTVKVDLGKDPVKRNSITRRQLSFVRGDALPYKKSKLSPEPVVAEESEDIVEGTPTKAQLVRVNLLNDSPLSRTLVPEGSPAQIHIKSAAKEASSYSIFDPLPIEMNGTEFPQSQSNCRDASSKPSIPKIPKLGSPLTQSTKDERTIPQIQNPPPRENCTKRLSSTPISQSMDASLPITDSESIISASEQLPDKRKQRLALPLGRTCNQNPKEESEPLSNKPIPFRNITKRFKMTTTGIYDNVEKNAIKKLCRLIDATFSTELTRETTHLILPDGDDVVVTTKYMMALYNGSFIIPMRWVFDCIISKSILPEVNYFFKHSGIHRRMTNQHKPALFDQFLFYISPEIRKDEVNYKALKDLMSFCDCRITNNLDEIHRAASRNQCAAVVLRGEDYIPQHTIGVNNITHVSYKWFYACLTTYEIQPFDKPSFC